MIANVRGVQIHYTQQPEFWELVADGKWEPFTFDCIDKYCIPGSVFIDIGAWNGVFSVYAKLNGCDVYSVEPDMAAQLLFIQLHQDNGVKFHLFGGVIAEDNKDKILMSDGFGNSESSLVHAGKYSKTVQATTLSNLCDRFADRSNISLIKMDIEGAEIQVLSQAKDWITQHKPNMHISFHPSYIESYEGIMYLFDVYDCVSDNGTIVTADNFRATLDAHSHAFMFTRKTTRTRMVNNSFE